MVFGYKYMFTICFAVDIVNEWSMNLYNGQKSRIVFIFIMPGRISDGTNKFVNPPSVAKHLAIMGILWVLENLVPRSLAINVVANVTIFNFTLGDATKTTKRKINLKNSFVDVAFGNFSNFRR